MHSQAELIRGFNDNYRPKFNEAFFDRKNEDIINELKNVVLSCQRDKFFTIKVKNFRVVESYEEILKLLHDYEEGVYKKNKKKENMYDYIDIKSSDIILLVVTYYLRFGDEEETLDVYIVVPRIVDKYYFRINGNIFSAMYQIVDASTYNNSTTSAKKSCVTLKTMFMPIRVYRENVDLKNISKQHIRCAHYTSQIFNKTFSLSKYFLAKFGLYGAMKFLGIDGMIDVSSTYIDDPENFYVFEKNAVYITVPKYVFDRDEVVQGVTKVIYDAIDKDTTANQIRTHEFWLAKLGEEFKSNTIEKGLAILDSLESIYDISTKNGIHLPEEKKADIYCILRWMMGDFISLKNKSNLDISTKTIRYSGYIASLYAMKLSKGIYRVSDGGKRANLSYLKKAICIHPNYLMSAISRCTLVTYRNMVNDLDALTEIKFTYKGVAGIGGKANSVPEIYRTLDVSHLGRLDPDSSSNSDPGVTGSICPLAPLYDGHFSEFEEPNFWESQRDATLQTYRELTGAKQVIIAKSGLLDMKYDQEAMDKINEDLKAAKQIIKPIIVAEMNYDEVVQDTDLNWLFIDQYNL